MGNILKLQRKIFQNYNGKYFKITKGNISKLQRKIFQNYKGKFFKITIGNISKLQREIFQNYNGKYLKIFQLIVHFPAQSYTYQEAMDYVNTIR